MQGYDHSKTSMLVRSFLPRASYTLAIAMSVLVVVGQWRRVVASGGTRGAFVPSLVPPFFHSLCLTNVVSLGLTVDNIHSTGTDSTKVLHFNNDLTNTLTCTSPFHPLGAPFSSETLHGSITETAGLGITRHLLAPGLQVCVCVCV